MKSMALNMPKLVNAPIHIEPRTDITINQIRAEARRMVRNNGIKASSQALYDDLAAARSDRNKAEVDSLIRNAIQVIAAGFEEAAAGSAIEQVEVAVAEF